MGKNLSYYLSLNYPILMKQDKDNGKVYYEAEIPDLPGCGAHGKNKNEALRRLEEAKELWLSARLKRNLPIPEPPAEDEFSGKFLLRIPAKLHMELAGKAREEGLSLNQYVRSNLERCLTLGNILDRIKELEEKINELQKKPYIVTTTQEAIGMFAKDVMGQGASDMLYHEHKGISVNYSLRQDA